MVEALPNEFETGIYYGWASLEKQIYKMVMSIGWNPFFKNDKKSMVNICQGMDCSYLEVVNLLHLFLFLGNTLNPQI